jgi:checkpoint serine/threonine-protein kinase
VVGEILKDKASMPSKESNLACDRKIIFKENKEYSFEESRYDDVQRSLKDKKAVQKLSSKEPNLVKTGKELAHCASPTINTKAAMLDVFEMFSKPIHDSVWEDEDETISAKVYRPETFKIGVFHDEDEDGEELKAEMEPVRSKGVDTVQKDENLSDLSAKTPKLLATYPLQSTPLVLGLEKLAQSNPPATVMRPSLRPFDIMTPITEVSEDRTFAGISTIHSDKVRSSISGYDSHGSYCNQNGAENDILLSSFSRGEDSTGSSKKILDMNQSSIEVLNSLGDSEIEKENECNYEMMDIPNPCNPYDTTIINAILDSVPIPENSGLYSLMNETRGLQEELKAAMSRSNSKIDFVFQLGPKQKYKLVKKIAEGGYGQVYLVNNFKAGLLAEQDDDFTINCTFSSKKATTPQLALKLQSPPAPWEFYILSLLRSRLPSRVNDSIAKPISCYLFKDESALLMEYRNQGTLLNCVNLAHSGGYGAGSSCGTVSSGQSGVDELLAAFWTIELLRIIETVHAAGVIHGDVKVNLLKV